MIKSFRTFILLIVGLSLPNVAFAVNFSCDGLITDVAVYDDGRVLVNYGHGIHTYCSLSTTTTYLGKSAETCQAWYSTMLTARAMGKEIRFSFRPSQNPGKTSCSQLGNWTEVNSYYMNMPN